MRGHDQQRARELLGRDLDALEVHGHEYAGPLKLQVCGPWTLAASLEVSRGDKVLGDRGAVRDLIDSLAEGVADYLLFLDASNKSEIFAPLELEKYLTTPAAA